MSFGEASGDLERSEVESFALTGRLPAVVLDRDGFHHPRSVRGRGRAHTRYEELAHVAVAGRFLWVGTTRTIYTIPRSLFRESSGPDRLVAALRERIAARPDGAERLQRMEVIDRFGRRRFSLLATRGLAAVCVAGYLLQALFGVAVFEVGNFSPALVADGDLWRIVTAHLLHGFPLHLAVNLAGLLVLGRLVERVLGTSHTVVVMGVSGLMAMVGSALAGEGGVVGVSGVVFGLAGAALWLELHCAPQLPAWWRFPRTALLLVMAALVADGMLGLAVPFIAGEAHLGGLVGGTFVSAVTVWRPRLPLPPSAFMRTAARTVVTAVALAIGVAGSVLLAPGDFRARHATRLAQLPGITASELNDHAWLIAIAPEATREQLEAALLLARRAVSETGARDPNVLDTLAEVYFQLGRDDLAVTIIDEAIAQVPDEAYYREQRRRFTGERAPDDRPPEPAMPWFEPEGEPPLLPDELGVAV